MKIHRQIFIRLIFICAALSGLTRADTIFMLDGSTIECEVISEDAISVVIKTRAGKATIAKIEIKEIKKNTDPRAVNLNIREKMSELQKNDDKNITAWLKLGVEAKAAGSYAEMNAAFERALTLDPENPTIRVELGYIQRDGLWFKGSFFEESNKSSPTRPVTPRPVTPAIQLTERERLQAIAGLGKFSNPKEKLVDCPRCHGSGSIVMVDCSACARSPKPGFIMLIDGSYAPCEYCGGTRKVSIIPCSLCDKTGKVYLSQIAPYDGGAKKAPEGFVWCPNCNGSGIEAYQECDRCKGSQWPGYILRGRVIARCEQCAGKGKIPLTPCARCNGKGIIPANPPEGDKSSVDKPQSKGNTDKETQ